MIDDESFEGMCPTCGQHYHPPAKPPLRLIDPKKPVLNLILDQLDKLEAAGKSSTQAKINVAGYNALAVELGYRDSFPPEAIVVHHSGGSVTITPEDM